MKTRMTCEQFREALVQDRAGISDPAVQADLEEHRAQCPECALESRRDDWLCNALQSLPAETPSATSWQQVLEANRPARPARTGFRLALAGAGLTAVVAIVTVLHPFQNHQVPNGGPEPPPPSTTAVVVETDAYAGAHAMMSASDMTGDPNRDVILVYGASQSEKGGS